MSGSLESIGKAHPPFAQHSFLQLVVFRAFSSPLQLKHVQHFKRAALERTVSSIFSSVSLFFTRFFPLTACSATLVAGWMIY